MRWFQTAWDQMWCCGHGKSCAEASSPPKTPIRPKDVNMYVNICNMHVEICNMHVTDVNMHEQFHVNMRFFSEHVIFFQTRMFGKKSHVPKKIACWHEIFACQSQHGIFFWTCWEKIPCQHGAPFPDVSYVDYSELHCRRLSATRLQKEDVVVTYGSLSFPRSLA